MPMTRRSGWPSGDGEMARRIREADWAATSLGPIEDWPDRLCAAIDLMLASGFSTYVWWGPELRLFYNDAAIETARDRHPKLLGMSVPDSRPELWPVIEPLVQRVLATGKPEVHADMPMEILRDGQLQTSYFTFSYNPLPLEDGSIGGIVSVSIETTERILAERLVRENEARLATIFDALPLGVGFTDTEGTMLLSNPALRRFMPTNRLPSLDPERLHRWRLEGDKRIPPEQFPGARARRGERVVPGVEMLYTDDDGRDIWVQIGAIPVRDPSGAIIGQFATVMDVDAARRNAEALRESDLRARTLVEGIAQALWEAYPDGQQAADNPGWRAFTGQSAENYAERGWIDAVHPDDRERALAGWLEAAEHGQAFDAEFRIYHGDSGDWRWTNVRAVPLTRTDGTVGKWVGMNIDIHARRKAEEHQRILLSELQHRVRNTLLVIRSIIRRTGENSASVEEFDENLQGRVNAFSRVQSIVTRDPQAGIALRELVEDELLAHACHAGDRIRIDGGDVRLDPSSAESLSLAVHELATNAIKFGALGESGALSIRWQVEDGWLDFRWKERGIEVGEPGRRGFGSELLTQGLAYDLGAETRLDFLPDGLSFTLRMPLPALPGATSGGAADPT